MMTQTFKEDVNELAGYVLQGNWESKDFLEAIMNGDTEPEDGRGVHELLGCDNDEDSIEEALFALRGEKLEEFALEFGGGYGYVRALRILKAMQNFDKAYWAIRCAHADLQGSLSANEQCDSSAHDWEVHEKTIAELEEIFPFLDKRPS